jgi:hypothetical protein
MRPLLLHSSSAAAAPASRRVIHIEFAAAELPDGIQWHERVWLTLEGADTFLP